MVYNKNDLQNIANCPLCYAHDATIPYLSCKDFLVSGLDFFMVICQNCGHIYTNPIPNELNINKYYISDAYISHHDNQTTLFQRAYHAVKKMMIRRKICIVKGRIKRGSKVLDIGCGTGSFLEALKLMGYMTVGIEPGDIARERALKKDIDVYKNISALAETPHMRFHLISMWHVLEHIEDVNKQLEICHNLLDANAFLIIAVPLNKSFDAAFYKQFWAGYDLPRHLHHFSRETLKKAAASSGFILEKVESLPFDSFYVSLLSENYKKSIPKPIAAARAIGIGLVSNLLALTGSRPASSEIFIFRKQ